jgi:hypothetical protein
MIANIVSLPSKFCMANVNYLLSASLKDNSFEHSPFFLAFRTMSANSSSSSHSFSFFAQDFECDPNPRTRTFTPHQSHIMSSDACWFDLGIDIK